MCSLTCCQVYVIASSIKDGKVNDKYSFIMLNFTIYYYVIFFPTTSAGHRLLNSILSRLEAFIPFTG